MLLGRLLALAGGLACTLAGCAGSPPNKPVADYTNPELLSVFGAAARQQAQDPNAVAPLEEEIQKRKLLDVREADQTVHQILRTGMRSAVALAALGAPDQVVLVRGKPDLQIWRYFKFFAWVAPISVEPSEHDPVRWTPMNNIGPNDWAGPMIFVRQGMVVGLRILTTHKQDGHAIDPLVWATSGTTFFVPVETRPPYRTFYCPRQCEGLSL